MTFIQNRTLIFSLLLGLILFFGVRVIGVRSATLESPDQTGSILDHVDGFAAYRNTTGGEGESIFTVTSAANGGAGSLRNALSSGNRYIVFDPSLEGAQISLANDITVDGDNITIDGRGVNFSITGASIKFEGDNYVIAYLTFAENTDVEATDSITFRNAPAGGQRFFVYKCSFDHASDGLIDIIWNRGNDVYGTVKLTSFANHNKTILIGTNNLANEGGRYYISFSQNLFLNTTQRLPLTRTGYVHYYNNLVEKWGSAEGHGGGAFSGTGSQYLTENNIAIPYRVGEAHHDGGTVSRPLTKAFAPHFEGQGDVRSSGNRLLYGAYDVEKNPGQVPDPPYLYTLVNANSALEDFIRANVGNTASTAPLPATPTPSLTPAINPTATIESFSGETIKINFQSETAGIATGYLRDFGQPFGTRTQRQQGNGLAYGWVEPNSNTPLNLVGNGRLRWRNDDHRFDTLMHMQYTGSNGIAAEGAWEIAVPNGPYVITVSTGDAKSQNSMEIDYIAIEGVQIIEGFVRPGPEVAEGSFDRHMQVTALVEVLDGRLTIDAIGGTNTKINFVEFSPFEPSETITPIPTSTAMPPSLTPTPLVPTSTAMPPSLTPTPLVPTNTPPRPSATPVESTETPPSPTPTIDMIQFIARAYAPIVGHTETNK